jgi:hypothetical protein
MRGSTTVHLHESFSDGGSKPKDDGKVVKGRPEEERDRSSFSSRTIVPYGTVAYAAD